MAVRSTPLSIALVAFFVAGTAHAQPRIDLITVEPGPALYERFGHTALRVYAGDVDVVYSFGAAPFFEPSFLWKFARGEGEFRVVAETYATTLARYRNADRTLLRQELLLPDAQRNELAQLLAKAATPPRDRYVYDQLYDNCATRIRDLIDRTSGGALTRAASLRKPSHRYRDDTLAAMAGHAVGHWALDLIGGRHQDLRVTSFHEMYLPVVLRDRVAEARLVADGGSRPLARKAEQVFARRGPPLSQAKYGARIVMLALAACLSAIALGFARAETRMKRLLARFAARILAVWSGVFGCLVWPLTLLSNVHNFSPNENALLFWPTDLWLAAAISSLEKRRGVARAFRAYLALRLLSVCGLLVLKLLGLCTQHNGVFICVALLMLLALAARARPWAGWLEPLLRAKRSRA